MSALSEALATARASRGETIDTVVRRAQAAGHAIDKGTISRYERDKAGRRLTEATIRALAAGFLLSEREVRRLADIPPGELGPWVPTEKAARLNRDQRDALDRFIEAMVRPAVPDLFTNGRSDDDHTTGLRPAPNEGHRADHQEVELSGESDVEAVLLDEETAVDQGDDDVDHLTRQHWPEHQDHPQL